MKTFIKGIGALALGAICLVGCGSGGDGAKSEGTSPTGGKTAAKFNKKELKITLIAKSNDNPVFISAAVGAKAAAEKYGKDNNIKIIIDNQTPATEDAQLQAQKIAAATNGGADAILLSCSDASKVNTAINDAVSKGVAVMTFDSDAPESKRFAFYGADDEAVGKQVMKELAAVGGSGQLNVAILAGNQNAPNLQRRSKAVIEEAKNYKNVKIVDTYHHIENPQDASAEVTKDMNAHPEINAWAMIGGWPLFNTALLSLDPNKVKIVSVDALPAELAYVDKGVAPVLLAQPVYDWGYKSVGFIVDKVVLGKDVQAINKMELVKVTKDNLKEWAKTLQSWGFTDVDPKFLK